MPELHEIGIGLFVFLSITSLILVVAKPIATEFEATALRWIRAFKRIRAELRTPLRKEESSQPPPPLNHTRSKRELG